MRTRVVKMRRLITARAGPIPASRVVTPWCNGVGQCIYSTLTLSSFTRPPEPRFNEMRQAKHLHPEWGVLAPPQSVVRTIRTLLITTAVSAATCSGVILSLVDRIPDQTSVAARTLATPVAASIQPPSPLFGAQVKSPSVIESDPTKATASLAARAKPATYSALPQKKANKKHHAGPRYASGGRQFTSLMDDWYHAVGL
jgi:hypothetical protein